MYRHYPCFLCFPEDTEQSPKNPVFVNEHVYRYNHEKDCKEQDKWISVCIITFPSKDNDSLTRSVYDSFSNIMCHVVGHITILHKSADQNSCHMSKQVYAGFCCTTTAKGQYHLAAFLFMI